MEEQKVTFKDLGLSESTLKALTKKGFESPTPIQALTIPALLTGTQDIIGQAQTGTGKTAAFGLQLIELLEEDAQHVQALILAPTRELAIQVSEELTSLKGSKRLNVVPVYGGQAISVQFRQLKKGADIIVGTPGRIIDHLNQGTLKLNKISHLVLDEADEMLNRGFLPEIEEILKHANKHRRTVLFSATMEPEILAIAKNYMHDYELLKVKSKEVSCSTIEQVYFNINQRDRFSALCRLIESEAPFYGLVFCRTKMDTEQVAEKLAKCGFPADALNGNMSQHAREKILSKFKNKTITILVATDIAARGIDVKNVSQVINYGLPRETEAYIHRIGRTGRAGQAGKAFSFVIPADKHKLRQIERLAKTTIREAQLPTSEEISTKKQEHLLADLLKKLNKKPREYYVNIAKELLEEHHAETIIAMLLKEACQTTVTPETVTTEFDSREERPHRERRERGERRFGQSDRRQQSGRRRDSKRSDNSRSKDRDFSKKRFDKKKRKEQ